MLRMKTLFYKVIIFLSLQYITCSRAESNDVKNDNDFVQKVHIIFMNHLDVGYAGYVGDVVNKYFTEYFPRAVSVARDLKKYGYIETFVYTTHPWLVTFYVDCPPNFVLNNITIKCPNATEKSEFISAIKSGIVTWHAGPMNLQVEMADDWLFGAGLDISMDLDRKFNIRRPVRVLSQRDVPGMTEAAIPVLVSKGISGVSVGVNNRTPPPAVPSLFVWKKGSSSVIATFHPGGYPDDPGSHPVTPGGLSRKDCIIVSGFSEALCFAFRTDNTGPPADYQEVLSYYEILRAEFPNAQLTGSRFDDYFSAVNRIRSKLPVVTGEIGDTWIQGVASDPHKCATYRAVSRVIRSCIRSGKCLSTDERLKNAVRFLIKLPEHTWGLPSDGDNKHWNNTEFYPLRNKAAGFVSCARSWLEQRQFIDLTLKSLTGHPVVPDIQRELSNIKPAKPDLTGFVAVNPGQVFQCPKGNIKSLQFGLDGSIVSLNHNGIDWVNGEYNISSFIYRTYNEKDFVEFNKLYAYAYSGPGYFKNGMQVAANPESKVWSFNATNIYTNKAAECDFYASIEAKDSHASTYYGAPKIIWLRYTVRSPASDDSGALSPGIDISLQWFDKTITRLAESLTLSFKIKPQPSYNWQMYKLNQPVDPLTVRLNGSQYQHVLDDNGAVYSGKPISLQIRSLDVPIGCPIVLGEVPRIFPAPLQPIRKPLVGIAFNMYNNLWSTNYIMWYPYLDGDANFKARFTVEFINKDLMDYHDDDTAYDWDYSNKENVVSE